MVIFNLSLYMSCFLAGVAIYQLYINRRNWFTWMMLALSVLAQLLASNSGEMTGALIVMNVLFLIFIFFPSRLGFFKNRMSVFIGLISYSLYLIHEDVGVLLIHHWGPLMGQFSGFSPIIVGGMLILFSAGLYRFFEQPLSRRWKLKPKSLEPVHVSDSAQ